MNKALTLSQLKKTYSDGTQALHGIDLEVDEGDFFALLGPNGAGKSTTIGIISSLINKTAGSVHIFGKDIHQDAEDAKGLLGLVPQEFNFNVFEPVEEILINQAGYYGIARRQAYEQSKYYLKQLGLWEKRRSMARQLSGGMKRRLMIARALIHQPRLLILDEPTAGVDIEIRRSTWEFLQEINRQGTTIILTTHYLEEAEQLCKNIAIINHGRLVENTSVKSLLGQLHAETFILNSEKAISRLPELNNYPLHLLDETTIEVELSKGQDLNTLFQQLSLQDIEIVSMRNKSNRLEELFIRMLEGETRQ